jgi:hypothetical protein
MDEASLRLNQEQLQRLLATVSHAITEGGKALGEFTETQDPAQFGILANEFTTLMTLAFQLGIRRTGDLARYGKELGLRGSLSSDIHLHLALQSLLYQVLRELGREMAAVKQGIPSDSTDFEHLIFKLQQASVALKNR